MLYDVGSLVEAKLGAIVETLGVEANLGRKTLNVIIVIKRCILREIVML